MIYEVTLSNPYSTATLFVGVTDWYQSQVIENQWVFDDELEAPEEAPQFLEQAPASTGYVPGPEHPPSLDYVPGPKHLPLPDYVHGPEYPEYLVPSDNEEDPEEDPAEYPADEGDDDDDDEDKEEEEHLALADSTTLPAIDHVPLAEDTEALETNESTPTPTHTSPTYVEAPLAATEALIDAVAAALPLTSPPPSPLTPLSSPLPQIPSSPLPLPSPQLPLPAPSPPLLLPATNRREDVPEADVPPRKRLCLTAPAHRFEVGESLGAATARQPGLDINPTTDYSFVDIVDATPRRPMSREVGYGITDVSDDMVGDMQGRADEFFYDHVDDYTRMDLDFAVDGNLKELSCEKHGKP
ncbi:hypothetical protein Tco_0889486 [Tanacetum coccineum]